MNRHSQKGSALLIVLGFLSFMVVSAVAFAIWMRNERLPSSALRRNVANRYLVKAALAQAMSRVDDAIRSHAYPGAWYTNQLNAVYHDPKGFAYDWWESRVFMPPDPENAYMTRYAPVSKTVSVLNLEALGYLPPGIVNDVRLLSRSSWAAQWDYFNFDAGRYAFCAVNVSDMFDINKLAADRPRTSAATAYSNPLGQKKSEPPPSRFSLAYLFRDNDEALASPNSTKMKEFDDSVHGDRSGWDKAPLVSLMDYNLSVGAKKGSLRAPFYEYISGGVNGNTFYGGGGGVSALNTPYVKDAERQPFVTASWFPPSDSNFAKSDGSSSTPLDLSQHQPFQNGTLKSGNHDMFYTQTAENRKFWETMLNNGKAFCQMDEQTLFDYLDEDDVPLSLAMPCVERVPMITALAPGGNVQVAITPLAPVGTGGGQSGSVWVESSQAQIQITLGSMDLSTTLLFPFKDGKTPVGCTAQAFARLVFVAQQTAAGGGGGGGAAGSAVSLRNNGFARNFRPLSDSEWTAAVGDSDQFKLEAGSSQGNLTHTQAGDCLLVTLPGVNASWTPPAKMTQVQDCWKDMQLPLQMPSAMLQMPIVQKYDVYNVVPATPTTPASKGTKHLGTYYQILLNPFDANGNVIDLKAATSVPIPDAGGEQGMESTTLATTLATTLGASYTISPYLVTWARVMQAGKTVDMVPATYEDDKAFNSVDNTSISHLPLNNPLGNSHIVKDPKNPSPLRPMPIMRFPGTLSFDFNVVMSGTAYNQPNQWAVKSCYAVDPRFNWAPEDWWFDANDPNPTGKKWYDAVFNTGGVLDKLVQDEFNGSVNGRGDRATAPFLFVSNLGYLQSVGELVFLPHLSDMMEDGAEPNCVLGDKKGASSNNGSLYDGTPRDLTTVETMPCALAAWKSYQSYRTNPKAGTFEFGANLYRRGLVNGSQGFYINPYTQSQEVMLAALANTPLNYWVAGTNYTAALGKTRFNDFSSYNKEEYVWNASASPKITGGDMNKIATFLRRRFEDLASMIEIPQSMGEADLYVYQKVWEDMFDALDWGGVLDCTVEDVYKDLADYYIKGESNNKDYLAAYQKNVPNGYSDLNHFVRGGGKNVFGTGIISLNPDRALHKDDRNLMADPLRGQWAGSPGDTECYKNKWLYDVDRKFLHSYWRDCFGNRQQLFLIFVRAESTALGGTGEGTPAQQGGRAVALVWRDPEGPMTGGNIMEEEGAVESGSGDRQPDDRAGKYDPRRHPHKMRVLFYRQLD